MRFPKYFIGGSAVCTLIGGTILIRQTIVGNTQPPDSSIRADGKVAIITGANTGIGKETARNFAKRGAIVYLACRNMINCSTTRAEIIRETLNPNIYCRQCDLADFESIRSFVKEFKSQESRLDILVNNAGVMWTPKQLTKQGIEMQLGVNHMGHFLLTKLLLDTLKASSPSRIVVLTSIAHLRGHIRFHDLNSDKHYSATEAYDQSKLANLYFTKELAKRLEGTGVTVNAVHPGTVLTEITRHTGLFDSWLGKFFAIPILKIVLRSPVQGSYTTLHVALDPVLENVTGKYFSDCKEAEPSPDVNEKDIALRLWLTSEKWTEKYSEPI